jgi:threonylcarbamoyladenosine tRNA methylthiotransferase MtaB
LAIVKYSVITFGCRVNQSDSLSFEEELLASGARPASSESADVVVVNTCSVTASADQGARQAIRRIARLNPTARIVVTGCYATREREVVGQLPNVAHVVCNDDKPRLLSFIRRSVRLQADDFGPAEAGLHDCQLGALTSAPAPTTAERFGDGDGSCGASIEPGVAGRTAFTLRVQTGCAQPCSYCIIPETRGAPRSAALAQVLSEVRRVVTAGFKEVALTGVHLGSYGRDLDTPTTLVQLLHALRDEFGSRNASDNPDVLFRISSLEPMDCTTELVGLVAESTCFAPHFHLPLQHASSRMLHAMRRPYDLEYYAGIVDLIRRDIPHASIGSDLIVGFPGETDEDFELLAAYLECSPLTHLHVFPYSDRPGTAASRMRDRPAGVVVKARGARLRAIGSRLTRRFLDSQLGTVHRALTLEEGTLAVTGNYLKVRIPPGLVRNQWVTVRVTGTAPGVTGEILPHLHRPGAAVLAHR